MIFLSNNLKQDILNAARTGVDKDNVVLTFREYNDMLTTIHCLEYKARWLERVNKNLGEEIELLQKQALSRKLREARCICKLRGKCR